MFLIPTAIRINGNNKISAILKTENILYSIKYYSSKPRVSLIMTNTVLNYLYKK